MYGGDSFFTLTGAEKIGLVLLSLGLSAVSLFVAWLASRRFPLPVRIVIALTLFAAFIWLSPQVYYQYYRMIIDGLPAQIVIKRPVGFLELARTLAFQRDASLAVHSQGILGWALIGVAALRRRRGA